MRDDASKVAIVTGASRGIGAAVALRLGALGHKVVVNYVNNISAADSVVDEITGKGGTAIAVQGDVGSEADVLRIFETADKRFGQVTALVNNAGIVDIEARVVDMSADRLERMFKTNITGSFLCAREAVKRMALSSGGKGGVIVNVSSIAARIGSPNLFVDYAASKAAIDTFTKGLALEVSDDGIRVNAVRPGVIDTDIHAACGLPDRVEQIAAQLPMKRAGTANEVADAIVYLLSDEASYVTGGLLDVGGGR